MYSKFYSPNIISSGSSALGENSYSVRSLKCCRVIAHAQHHNDMDMGVSVIDSYTHHVLQYLETIQKNSKQTLQDLVSDYEGAAHVAATLTPVRQLRPGAHPL